MDEAIKKILDEEHLVFSTVGYGSGWAGGEPSHVAFVVFASDSRRRLFDKDDMRLGPSTDPSPAIAEINKSKMRELDEEVMPLLRNAAALLSLNSCRADPKGLALRATESAKLKACFEQAGLGPIYTEEIENEYGPKSSEETVNQPWFLVTTRIGHIKIGWRRSVINLDWSRTVVKASGEELFPKEEGDRDERAWEGCYIHAHGYEKAVEYLKVLAGAAP